jgi:hypothetical protein
MLNKQSRAVRQPVGAIRSAVPAGGVTLSGVVAREEGKDTICPSGAFYGLALHQSKNPQPVKEAGLGNVCVIYLRRRSIRASPPRPRSAVEDGSGTAENSIDIIPARPIPVEGV